MARPTSAIARFLIATFLVAGGTLAAQIQIELPIVVQMDALPRQPNPGGGVILSRRTFEARVIAPTGVFSQANARVFGLADHPRVPMDVFTGSIPLPEGDRILFSEVTLEDGSRPVTNAIRVRPDNSVGNLLGGRVGETLIFTAPATQATGPTRFDSAFRENSLRQQETLGDNTRIVYWTTPLTWHLVPQPGVAQPVGRDLALAFANADLTGSVDFMRLDGDPNATVLVSCLGPTASPPVPPTCTFTGSGTFREFFGTAVVRPLAALGLSPAVFLGGSALDLTAQPFSACAPATAPNPAVPLFIRSGGRVIGAWNNVPCSTAFDIRVDNVVPRLDLRNVVGTAISQADPGGLPDGATTLTVTAFNSSGPATARPVPLVSPGTALPGCLPGGLAPPSNARAVQQFLVANTSLDVGWEPVPCAHGYVVRFFNRDGTLRDFATAVPELSLFVPSGSFPVNAVDFAVASRGADGGTGPFSARQPILFQ